MWRKKRKKSRFWKVKNDLAAEVILLRDTLRKVVFTVVSTILNAITWKEQMERRYWSVKKRQ